MRRKENDDEEEENARNYDYFYLGGADMFLIVENLKRLLGRVDEQIKPGQPVLLGQWMNNGQQVNGGPGYAISRAVFQRFAQQALSPWRSRSPSTP